MGAEGRHSRRPCASGCPADRIAIGGKIGHHVRMETPCPVYLYRDPNFSALGDTFAAAAPLNEVISVYGGGGLVGEGGLSAAFRGAVVFKQEDTGQYFLGVWGRRNTARFRAALRSVGEIAIIAEPPPARLIHFNKQCERPKRGEPKG